MGTETAWEVCYQLAKELRVASKGTMYVSIAGIRGCSSTRSTHASYAYEEKDAVFFKFHGEKRESPATVVTILTSFTCWT